MKLRILFPMTAAIGLIGLIDPAVGLAGQPSSPPAPLPASATNPNQLLADAVAAQLRAAGVIAGADISIVCVDGAVHLTGKIQTPAQRERVLAVVKDIRGVSQVRDHLITPSSAIVQIQDLPFAPIAPSPLGPPTMASPIVEPAPVGLPGQVSPDQQAPPLPPYAWPTYAPHNNVSRVAYPEAYPYNAFPFIGPYYPFPKVPLGWRKVTLEWEDGHWFLGRNSAPQDYWRVRFW